ncbi:MAG TPA: arginine deiminase-related protein [Candidatus Saccharimonadales bacterium]|nr:arginine deiminase-related protein [Candidatus Saccharimonadales bacterium]
MKHTLIKKILMCKPTYFDQLNYVINPWMTPGTINEKKAMQEWEKLVDIYRELGAEVEIIEQHKDSPDMVFATDQGIVRNKTVLLSRFWTNERKKESTYYETWFQNQGYDILYLPENVYFEGNGDSFFWNNKLLVGIGYRANKQTCDAVGKLLDIEVIPLEIIDPKFYHLDVGFFPLNKDTAFYYPPAFSQKSRGVLKKLVPNLIELTEEEVNGFCANSVVTDHHVIHQKGNPTFTETLKQLGYKSIEVDVSEFMKSGGGIHCLTNILLTK